MENAKMIINSVTLSDALRSVPNGAEFHLSTASIPHRTFCLLNGGAIGIAQRPFDPIRVPFEQGNRLLKVVEQLEEQPVTLVWDGEHFTIKDFVI